MKVTVSLPAQDVEFLDVYARAQGLAFRSAVIQKSVGLLRSCDLGPASEESAWEEWPRSWSGVRPASPRFPTYRDGSYDR